MIKWILIAVGILLILGGRKTAAAVGLPTGGLDTFSSGPENSTDSGITGGPLIPSTASSSCGCGGTGSAGIGSNILPL